MIIVDVLHPENPERKVRVGVFGSCRARDMVVNLDNSAEGDKARENSFPCKRVAYNFSIFTHTPSQAKQYYHFLRNRNEFMEEIQPMIFSKPLSEAEKQLKPYTPELLDSIEMFVVEACTLNNFTCNGIEVGSTYSEQKFVKSGGKPLLKWWRALTMGKGDITQDVIDETLAALPSKDIPDNLNTRYIIQNLKKRVETKEEFHRSLTALADTLKVPMVVLPHFDIPGEPLVERHEMRSYIDEFAPIIGYNVYDTTALIGKYGREYALAGDGTSVNHYSHSFNHVLLNHFRPYLLELHEQLKEQDIAQRLTA